MFAYHILWLMMVYLTDVWELELVHAAAIINIWTGSVRVLPIFFAHLADAFLGNNIVVLFSSLSSMIGIGLIWLSTPPVLGKSIGSCTQYKSECIGKQQKQLLYAGLALTSVGMASQSACYGPFAHEQVEESAADNNCDCVCVCVCVCYVGGVISGYNLTPRPEGSPLTTIFRVLFASTCKSFCTRPHDMNELYEKPDPRLELLPHTKSLGCLDKAAIINTQLVLEQQEKTRWRLCKVTEVEETKIFIRTIPLWMTFIFYGIISSLSATYFLEQAKRLDPRVGKAKAPLILFLWFYDKFRRSFTASFFCTFIVSGHFLPRIGMVVAMVFGALSCITAAMVETRRLGIVQSHGLIDKPKERVPMTIFWLLPQFVLLGGLDGIYKLCAFAFSYDQAPQSMIKYFNLFARGFFGLGIMGSVAIVYLVGMISELKTGTSWFHSTLNLSRLDNYYWLLASMVTVNLAIYLLVASFHRYRDSRFAQWQERMLVFMKEDDY
ncbi:hypothetical protein BVRB_8g185140 [Beta vulgaris subsp. vulgaris]|uniref:Uncharacterized protein n=1 Tax=Beta vulgaris subsp. vulgaris TaxID=3555 RepID=A0A0J8BW36_BETVV|nr:hypothetical protein BVRB_8g185140 [Beta vulgaris subsp. vulgaris]